MLFDRQILLFAHKPRLEIRAGAACVDVVPEKTRAKGERKGFFSPFPAVKNPKKTAAKIE